jgi:hypothetical protein
MAEAGVEFPDFHESMAKAQRESQARREAFDAARAGAAGKSRAEIRDLYESELRSRGLEIPSEEILDARVDAISGDYRSSVRLMGQALGDMARFAGGLFFRPRC